MKIAEQRAGQGCSEKALAHLSAQALTALLISSNDHRF